MTSIWEKMLKSILLKVRKNEEDIFDIFLVTKNVDSAMD